MTSKDSDFDFDGGPLARRVGQLPYRRQLADMAISLIMGFERYGLITSVMMLRRH
jgi:hypothetical protein